MKVNIVNIKIFFVIVIIFILLGFILNTYIEVDFVIEIQNNTSETISNLNIVYHEIEKEILVPSISPGESIVIEITPKEQFGENQMWISYKDDHGEIYKEIIFGYFEMGYNGKALVKIVDIDKDAILKFEIESDIKL